MNTVPIKRVLIEMEDGTTVEYKIPPHSNQGFYRQRYTYDGVYDAHGNFSKWTNRIHYHEVIWTLNEDQVQSDQYQPTFKSPGGSTEPHTSGNGTDAVA